MSGLLFGQEKGECMSIVRDEKISGRFLRAAAVAAFLVGGAMTSGCSHPAAPPAAPPAPTAATPAPAAAPGAPGAPAPSPMSAGDQQEMQQKQDENKGITAPP